MIQENKIRKKEKFCSQNKYKRKKRKNKVRKEKKILLKSKKYGSNYDKNRKKLSPQGACVKK